MIFLAKFSWMTGLLLKAGPPAAAITFEAAITAFQRGGWVVSLIGAAAMVGRLLIDDSKDANWIRYIKYILAASIFAVIAFFVTFQWQIAAINKAIIQGMCGALAPELVDFLTNTIKDKLGMNKRSKEVAADSTEEVEEEKSQPLEADEPLTKSKKMTTSRSKRRPVEGGLVQAEIGIIGMTVVTLLVSLAGLWFSHELKDTTMMVRNTTANIQTSVAAYKTALKSADTAVVIMTEDGVKSDNKKVEAADRQSAKALVKAEADTQQCINLLDTVLKNVSDLRNDDGDFRRLCSHLRSLRDYSTIPTLGKVVKPTTGNHCVILN
jgi:vacuolar-type H+-ATPase subunit F/Vma7